MNQLVTIKHDQPVTTSLAISEGVDLAHKSVIQLVRKYADELAEFERVAFEMRPFETPGGTQAREIAILNEPQATLLITFMKNTEVVRRFKKELVRAFFAMRERLSSSSDEGQPVSPGHRADNMIAAARCFRGLMSAGRSMGLARNRVVVSANAATVRATGVDLIEELDAGDLLEAGRQALPKTNVESVEEFWNAWLSGETPLPVCVCRTEQLYEAYLFWCSQRDITGAPPLYMAIGWMKRQQGANGFKSHIKLGYRRSQTSVLVPPGIQRPLDCTKQKWVSDDVQRFGAALEEWKRQT